MQDVHTANSDYLLFLYQIDRIKTTFNTIVVVILGFTEQHKFCKRLRIISAIFYFECFSGFREN